MGQQHRKIVKRRRRAAYLERKKAKTTKKITAPRKDPVAKPKGKKQAAASSVESAAKS